MTFLPFSNSQEIPFLAFRSKNILASKSVKAHILYTSYTFYHAPFKPIWAFDLVYSFKWVLWHYPTPIVICHFCGLEPWQLDLIIVIWHFIVLLDHFRSAFLTFYHLFINLTSLIDFDWHWLMLTLQFYARVDLSYNPPPHLI